MNTVLTQLLYMAMLFVMSYSLSFTLSYVVGIYLAYYLNSRIVFKQPMHWRKALQFPVVYLLQYVLGLGLLYVMIEWFRIHEMIAPLPVVLILLPVTFLMSRYIIKPSTGDS